jgi:4'-phosphopantetheinyl transferase
VPDHDDWLSVAERDVLAGLERAPRRRDWRLGRWTAKHAVAAWRPAPGDLETIAIIAAEDGAPEVYLNGQPAPVAISLTHRDGVAVCAIAADDMALGCDLEAIEPRDDVFVRDWFTANEQAAVDAADTAARPLVVNLIWSGKESAAKAAREGLRLATKDVAVTFPAAVGHSTDWRPFEVAIASLDLSLNGRWRCHRRHVLTVAGPSSWDADPTYLAPTG